MVDGVVVITCARRYGDLKDSPLTIEVENNRIRSMKSENKDLRDEFRTYTNTDENSDRVGEFAIGTNTACTHIIGTYLTGRKIPGVHIAFGIRMASTPARIGFRRHTLTVWDDTSTSGSTASK